MNSSPSSAVCTRVRCTLDTLGPVPYDSSPFGRDIQPNGDCLPPHTTEIIEDPSISIDTLGRVQDIIANNMALQMQLRRCQPTRDCFRSDRFSDYLFLRPHWTNYWWPKPPPAVQRRLPTHAGYRLAGWTHL